MVVDSVTIANAGVAGACVPANAIFSYGFELGTLVPAFSSASP